VFNWCDTGLIWVFCNGYSAHEIQRCSSSRIFLYCKAALPNLTWPYLSEQAGTECCYGKEKKKGVCPLQAASYWLLSIWDGWQVWRCNLKHSSLGLKDSHRSIVMSAQYCTRLTMSSWELHTV